MIKIAVSGCNGRMGSGIKKLVESDPGLKLAGAFDAGDDPYGPIRGCDVLIEFTTPDATVKNVAVAKELRKPVVIGTTGLDKDKIDFIKEASRSVAIVFAPNMSVGVNLLFKLTQKASSVLDSAYNVSISETHHIHKKDAPSGTAKRLRELVAGARGMSLDNVKVESHRIGEVVGDHAVVFDGAEETVELRHHAKSREVFMRGAVLAAQFVAGRKAGLYGMDDVLGI